MARPDFLPSSTLVDQVPDELFTMDDETYASLILAKAEIKDILARWEANRIANQSLVEVKFSDLNNPVAQIRGALALCPDESPAPGTSELNFITDPDLTKILRSDIGATERALSNGEWKAATVLAGSCIEAILLWDITNRHAATYPAAVAFLAGNGTF